MKPMHEMEFCKFQSAASDRETLRFVEALYMSAFPPEERRPFSEIVALTESSPCFSLLLLREAGHAVGFLSYWQWERLAYIEHFALSPDCRGRGLGSSALAAFCASVGCPVVLEVEPPTAEAARRRIAFYRRAGFVAAPQRYVQPPYSAGLPPVELLLMAYGAVDWARDFDAVRDLLHREVYGAEPMSPRGSCRGGSK